MAQWGDCHDGLSSHSNWEDGISLQGIPRRLISWLQVRLQISSGFCFCEPDKSGTWMIRHGTWRRFLTLRRREAAYLPPMLLQGCWPAMDCLQTKQVSPKVHISWTGDIVSTISVSQRERESESEEDQDQRWQIWKWSSKKGLRSRHRKSCEKRWKRLTNEEGKTKSLDDFDQRVACRYAARSRPDLALYGSSFDEECDIDSWLDFALHEAARNRTKPRNRASGHFGAKILVYVGDCWCKCVGV